MIFELILLFFAICSLSNSTLSILFLTAAAVSTIVRAQRAGKESTRLSAELEALNAKIQGELDPLKRQVQYLSQQLATLDPTKREEPQIRRQQETQADTAVAAKRAEPFHAAPPSKPAEVAKTVRPVPFTPASETISSHHVPAVPPPPLVPEPLAPPRLVPPPPMAAQAQAETEPIRIRASDLPEPSPAASAVPTPVLAKPAPEVTLDPSEAVLPHGAATAIQLPRAEPAPTEQRPAEEKSPSPLPTPVPVSSPISISLPAAPPETVPKRPPTPPPPRGEVPIAARAPSATVRQPASTASFTRIPEVAAPPAPRVHRRSLLEWLTWLLKFEERLGADWAAKIGIVLLVFGLTLLGLYEFKNMPNWGKVAIFYALSGVLLGAGIFAEKRERYKILGRTAMGGGWALFFFTTFAMQYVFAMQVLHNLVLDSILLLAVAAAMVFHTLRYRSQVVTGFAFLLAYSTIVLSQNAAHSQRTEVVFYSFGAGVILTLGIVVFAGRMHWFELEIFGVLSSYLAHFYWLYSLLGLRGAQGKMFPEFYPSAIILLSYWVIYRASYLLRNIRSPYEEVVSSIAAVLNTGLLLAAMRFQSAHPDLAFFALLALGALEFVLGQLPLTRRRRIAFILLTVLGTSLMVAAVPFRYAAEPGKVALLWLVAAEVFLVVGVVAREVVFRRLGKVIGVAVCIHMTWYALPELLKHGYPIHPIDPGILGEGVVFLIAGIAFQVNYFFAASRGKSYFTEKIDMLLAQFLSYAGSAALAVGLWAVLTPPWTLVAWTALMAALAFGGRRFAAKDASLQAGIVGAAGFLWALFVRTFVAPPGTPPEYLHLYFTVIPVVLAAVFFYATAWQIWSANASRQAIVRCLATWAGTLLLWILISDKVAEGWHVAALLLLATALAEAGARLQYRPLVWQVHALAAWALFLGFSKGYPKHSAWHGIEPRFLTPIVTAALIYWLAKRTGDIQRARAALVRDLYTWAGTAVVAVLIGREAPPLWVACQWLGYGIVLALIGRRSKLASLCYQECALAAVAIYQAFWVFGRPDTRYGHVSAQLLTTILAAAGLYFVSRRSYLAEDHRNRWFGYVHTSAATALLATLAWYQAPQHSHGWFAALAALLALALALIARRFELSDLPWQAHALAALAVLSAAGIDIQLEDKFHGIPLRMLAGSVVVIVLYLLGILLPFAETAVRYRLHVAYTLAPAVLVAALLSYQLPHEWVAVAWLTYGILLALAGRRWKRSDLCYEEVGLAAAAVVWTLTESYGIEASCWRVSLRLLTVSLVAAGLYSVSRFSSTVNDVEDDGSTKGKVALWIAYAHTWAATLLLTLLAWYEVPQHAHGWFPAIVALFAVVLAVLDRKLKAGEFGWQGQVLGAVAFLSAAVVDLPLADKFHGVSIRLLASLTVLAALYGLSVILRSEIRPKTELKYLYSWAALLLGCALAWSELQPRHPEWIAVAWLGYGIVLTLVGRRFKRPDLCWQEVILAAASIAGLLAFNFNDGLSGSIGPVSIRLVTVGLVAAGLYFASRRCYLEETETNRWIAYAHTWAATTALAVLCYKDAPADSWLPAMLAAFALLLALADRYWKTAELKWQAHALSAVALAFVAGNNIPQLGIARAKANGRVTGLAPAFMASLIVDLCFYLLSPLLRFSEEQRRRNFHHIYTWPASVLAAALIWYGVNETGVAIGWALLGVVLFWTGVHYKITHLRLQAYVALCSAFARIFFADLTEMPLTVAMVAAILYFVHATLRSEPELSANTSVEARLKVGGILAYLGTAAVGALCYYQFHKELAPIAWAVMVLLLLAAALWLHNSVYLHQAMLGTVAIFCYGVAYNLNRAWRITPLVFAIAILLLGLPLAYPLRRIGAAASSSNRLARIAKAFLHRPEQVLFFSAIVLLTFTMTRWAQGLITLGWGVEGILVYVIALLKKESTFRYTGWALVLLSLGKLVTHDAWIGTSPLTRILTVIAVALAWLLVAFFHSRYGEKFKEWL